jgi:hypothetical protein
MANPDIGAWAPPPLIPPHKGEGDAVARSVGHGTFSRLPPLDGEGSRVGWGHTLGGMHP